MKLHNPLHTLAATFLVSVSLQAQRITQPLKGPNNHYLLVRRMANLFWTIDTVREL